MPVGAGVGIGQVAVGGVPVGYGYPVRRGGAYRNLRYRRARYRVVGEAAVDKVLVNPPRRDGQPGQIRRRAGNALAGQAVAAVPQRRVFGIAAKVPRVVGAPSPSTSTFQPA